MGKALIITKLLCHKAAQFIDIACLVATISLMIYWNTPQYQSRYIWMHCHGAYVGDFVIPDSTHNNTISNFHTVFCYHSSLIIYNNSPEKSILESFGLYKIKGQ